MVSRQKQDILLFGEVVAKSRMSQYFFFAHEI